MIELRKISETASKMVIGWDPVTGAEAGYRGRQVGAAKWTQTQGTQMTFAKDVSVEVEALGVIDAGVYPPLPGPVKPTFTTNITDGQTITPPFTWTASTDPPAEKMQFWADGTMLVEDASAPFSHSLQLPPGTHELGLCAWHGSTRTCYDPQGAGKFATVTIAGAEPEPEPSDYTYRFATYNPATDKVTGCLSRFQPTFSWWVPGTPEVGTPWPDGGGIHEVTHPTYGPGFKLVSVDGMLYPQPPYNNPDSINCRNAVDPKSAVFGGDTRLRNPVPGSTHAWEGTYMRPPGQTWPANTQHESLWEMFATCNGFSNVFHHLFLSNGRHAPGFKYYFGRQVLTPTESPTSKYLWVRHVCPIEFAPGEYHTIRWQIKWSNPGQNNGFFRAQTSVNGGPFQQWLDLTNIDTTQPTFQSCYGAAQVGLRAPLNSGPLSFHVYNLGVKITP